MARRTITLGRRVDTSRTIEVDDDEVRELTSRWSAGDRNYVIERFSDRPDVIEQDKTELYSSLWANDPKYLTHPLTDSGTVVSPRDLTPPTP